MQLMLEFMGPPWLLMLFRERTLRRNSATAVALAWALTAVGVQAGGLVIVEPGKRLLWASGSANLKSNVWTLRARFWRTLRLEFRSTVMVRSAPNPSLAVSVTAAICPDEGISATTEPVWPSTK